MENAPEIIILAGGYGTRLHPLTEKSPKPLVKILSKPVISYTLEKARQLNPSSVTVTSMFMPDTLEESIRANGFENVIFKRERTPLGTAGAVKNAYSGTSGEILVLSGDGVFDFDLKKALEFHREKKAMVTVVTTYCDEPTEFGVVVSDEKGRITQFYEKPSWGFVMSSQINTGIYVLDKSILSYIPNNECFDFSKQLFPHLLRQKCAIYAYKTPSSSFWCDIGSFDELFACNCLAMQNKIGGIVNDGYSLHELSLLGVDVEEPVYVHKSVTLGKNIKLGKYTSIGENVNVCDGCSISGAIINENCTIGKGSGIYGCIIGKNTSIGENCIIPEGCVLGGENKLLGEVVLRKNTRLKTGRSITEESGIMETTKFKNTIFCDRGVFCGTGDVSPEHFSKLGCALAKVMSDMERYKNRCVSVGVMTDGKTYSSVVGELFRAGLRATGADVYDLGKGDEALATFCAISVVQSITAYVYSSSDSTLIKLIDERGFTVSRKFENRLEKVFRADKEFEKPTYISENAKVTSCQTLYYASLINSVRDIKNSLSNFKCCICEKEDSQRQSHIFLKRALAQYGAEFCAKETDECLCVYLSPDGTNVYVRQENYEADMFHIGAILLNNFESYSGERIFLPDTSPEVYYSIVRNRNIPLVEEKQTEEYKDFVSDGQILRTHWLRDGVFAALRLCFVLKQSGKTLGELLSEIPDFSVFTDELVGIKNRSKAMEALYTLDSSNKASKKDSLSIVLPNGTVTVIPGRVAGFKIISEAHSFEAAKELCDKIEDVMKNLNHS